MQEITLTIPGFSIAGKTWGNPKNPPILALHGWLDNANSFAPLASYLQNDFYLIAVDFPGHGLSSHLPPGCNYHFFDGIFIIIEIIKALKLDKVHLLGHSMGACMGSLVAGVAPERLRSLYLIEALGPFSSPAKTACSQLTEYAKFISHTHRSPKGYEQFESAAYTRSQKGYVSIEIARLLCERGLVEKEGRFYWRHDRRLIAPTPLRMTEEQVLSCLQNISTKTHLLLSDEGFAFDAKIMENRIKAVKNMVVGQLNGGHHIHMEKPELVGRMLVEFYK
ncbi:MAG: Tropinesterase [Legionella sp.]|uniref:alpha/beta fold hydrolase n=1 Tax=Legionella sp. TaxID=459 RepID=UPI003D117B81